MTQAQYFPADVSLRVEGDLEAAQKLFPAAKQLLYKALRRQELGKLNQVKMFMPGTDGSLIWVVLIGQMKHLYVAPAVGQPGKGKKEEEKYKYEPPHFSIYTMYSGAVLGYPAELPPSIWANSNMTPDSISDTVLRSFHPDTICAAAYGLTPTWQEVEKLAVNVDGTNDTGTPQSWLPKPGMYTGSMKRCVQALYGIGRNETDTEAYFTEEIPEVDEFEVINITHNYDYHWNRSHGLTRVGNGFWVVEISQLNGVLAMPMQVFLNTDTDGYISFLEGFGDYDTAAVAREFGGLPTGEHFPTGLELEDAIANGKVLQLMPPEDLADFYHDAIYDVDKMPLHAAQGWAFSEIGNKAINTCIWYSNVSHAHPHMTYEEFYGINEDTGIYSGVPFPLTSTDPRDYFARVEYYWIDIVLSDINTVGFITAENPCGSGSAMLTQMQSDLASPGETDLRYMQNTWDNEHRDMYLPFHDNGCFIYVPRDGDDTQLDHFEYHGNDRGWTAGPDPSTLRWSYVSTGETYYDPSPPNHQRAHYDWMNANVKMGGQVFYAFFVGEEPELLTQVPTQTYYLTSPRIRFLAWFIGQLRGTTLDVSNYIYGSVPNGPAYPEVQTVIPWGCREGYLFMWSENYTGNYYSPGRCMGFFDDFGVVEFSPNPRMLGYYPALSNVEFLEGTEFWRSYFWNNHYPLRCSLTVNCGQRECMVGTDGAIPVQPFVNEYMINSGGTPEIAIPIDTESVNITFVGSP